MSLTTTAAAAGPIGAVELTRSPVPAALPPRAAPGSVQRAAHRPPESLQQPWAPRPHPDRGHGEDVGERARREVRREEERTVRAVARAVAVACVEAELGLRPPRQLSQWLDLPTYDKMVRRSELARRIRPSDPGRAAATPTALGARVCPAGADIYEASATVRSIDRTRAAALRIERHRGRWKVTALELG